MFDSLVDYTIKLPREEVRRVEIEEMAIVAAWYESQAADPEKRERYAAIPEITEYWINNVIKDDQTTEGRRLQPLLRYILDQAVLQGIQTLHRNELDVLAMTYDLIQRVPDKKLYARLNTFFGNKIIAIRERRASLPNSAGLVGVRKRLTIITPGEILGSRPRSVRSFAGVNIPARGPVYESTGDTKVMGAVPEDCMVVVDGGACLVNGYVLGRIAASTACEVRENISGMVIVRDGDVRAKNILTNAYLVSKWGDVHVRSTENPKLIFGGRKIKIHESARHGNYAAPVIEVVNDAIGGDFGVSQLITADHFRQSDSRDAIISLRRRISCEDYGGLVDRKATKMITRITKLRRRRDNWKNMETLAQEECEHFAANGLSFMAGGEDLKAQLEQIDSGNHRMAYLNRLVAALDSILLALEDRLNSRTDSHQAEAESETKSESLATARDLQNEMQEIEAEGELAQDLKEEYARLDDIVTKLSTQSDDEPVPASTLFEMRDRRNEWLDVREELKQTVQSLSAAVRNIVGNSEIFSENTAELTEMKLFGRLLSIAYKRPVGDRLFERANTNFIQLMLRQIENRRQRIRSYQNMLDDIARELKAEIDILERECHMPPPKDNDETPDPPQARGKFEQGITICTERNLLDEKELPKKSIIKTKSSGDDVWCYVRQRDKIVLLEEEVSELDSVESVFGE